MKIHLLGLETGTFSLSIWDRLYGYVVAFIKQPRKALAVLQPWANTCDLSQWQCAAFQHRRLWRAPRCRAGSGPLTHSFSHLRRTFPDSQEKAPPTSNFSIPVFKVTPASLSQGSKRADTLRVASDPRGFRTGGEKSPYCVDNHLGDLTHTPGHWGSIPLAVRLKPQKQTREDASLPHSHIYTSIFTLKPQGC